MILGVDGWSRHDEDADHLAHAVREVVGHHLGEGAVGRAVLATHEIRLVRAHLSVSCVVPERAPRPDGPVPKDQVEEQVRTLVTALAALLPASGAVAATAPGLPDGIAHGDDGTALTGAWVAVAAAAARTSGRLVHFPGEGALTGRLTVADVLAASVVDEVVVLGGAPHLPSTVLDTLGYVRPRLEAGRVRLLVQPGPNGTMVPFDREDTHDCCQDH